MSEQVASVEEVVDQVGADMQEQEATERVNDNTKLIGYDSDIFTTKEEKAEDLKRRFMPSTAKVVRKEMFANLRDPAVTIRNGSITFNTACINGLEDVVYVNLLVNEKEGIFAVKRCEENDKDALRWCIAKPDKRKSRKMTCPGFTDYLFKVMGWDSKFRYKVLGYRIDFDGEAMYVFDLGVPKTFREKPKKGEGRPEDSNVDYRKGFFADDIANSFGVPYEEHQKTKEVSVVDGLVSLGMLTGIKREKKDPEDHSETEPVVKTIEALGAEAQPQQMEAYNSSSPQYSADTKN